MKRRPSTLLDRRLLLVTGKGGTGKTSIAAALGVAAARRGIETVVVETSDRPLLPALLAQAEQELPPADGRNPVPVSAHLYTLRIDPKEALTEYLELQLPLGGMVRRLIQQSGFRRLLDAAPGWRELITLGKLWHLESRTEGAGPRWGLLVVDAPATGHGLSLLSVPNVVVDTVRLGPLRRHTDRVQALLHDPERTRIVPVTLLEEMPVKETLELCARIEDLGLHRGSLIANCVETPAALPALEPLLEALGRITADELAPPLPGPQALSDIAEHAARRSALQARFMAQLLDARLGEVIQLPLLDRGISSRKEIEQLADELERHLDGQEPRA